MYLKKNSHTMVPSGIPGNYQVKQGVSYVSQRPQLKQESADPMEKAVALMNTSRDCHRCLT